MAFLGGGFGGMGGGYPGMSPYSSFQNPLYGGGMMGQQQQQ